jgi:hypothetical protein
MTTKNLYAFTSSHPDSGIFPEYISLNVEEGDRTSLTVRGPMGYGGVPGHTITIQLSRTQLRELASAINAYV